MAVFRSILFGVSLLLLIGCNSSKKQHHLANFNGVPWKDINEEISYYVPTTAHEQMGGIARSKQWELVWSSKPSDDSLFQTVQKNIRADLYRVDSLMSHSASLMFDDVYIRLYYRLVIPFNKEHEKIVWASLKDGDSLSVEKMEESQWLGSLPGVKKVRFLNKEEAKQDVLANFNSDLDPKPGTWNPIEPRYNITITTDGLTYSRMQDMVKQIETGMPQFEAEYNGCAVLPYSYVYRLTSESLQPSKKNPPGIGVSATRW